MTAGVHIYVQGASNPSPPRLSMVMISFCLLKFLLRFNKHGHAHKVVNMYSIVFKY